MKLLFENWRAYLNEGQKQELWQAMIDASPGGKWRKLAYKHPTRVAYRDYLASSAGQGGKGGPLVTPPMRKMMVAGNVQKVTLKTPPVIACR